MSTIQKEAQEFFRAKEAASLLRIGESTWWRWVADGRISRGVRVGQRVTLWPREEVLSLLDGGAA